MGDDLVHGRAGGDLVHARSGEDHVYGGRGDDVVYLGPGGVDFEKSNRVDQAHIGPAATTGCPGAADPTSCGAEPGADHAYGGRGDDVVKGG